ncbi:MAG: hypothetical protein KAT75_04310 [Dehalococcoidia bacterium]|nr:hypothetical protein [Dehalococcoidia bacterium]
MDTRKSIKIEEPVYRRLDAVRGKGETFSQVIDRLLAVVEAIRAVPLGPRPESLTHKALTREDWS